jgi:AraC-like DNA-binding protein
MAGMTTEIGSAISRELGPAVLAAAATGVVPFIERYHGDVDRIFGHAGISPEMAGSPTLQLSLKSFCRLFEESARLTRNDNFGLWFGNAFDPRDLGLWGYCAISAPTVGAALQNLVDLHPFQQQSTSMQLVSSDDLLRLEYRIDAPDIVERRQDAELSLGMFRNVIREGLGSTWTPDEVHFEHPRPEGWREHERAFGAPVFFSQPTNALVFRPDKILTLPMPAQDARLMAAMRLCLERLSERNDLRISIVDRVRAAVRARLPEGFPTLESIASELRLPMGVVQRELHYEGLSYNGLVEMTRRDLALSYMRQRQLPFSEIAFLVGYSELSAFSRAVRRWTGQSPRSLRTRMLQELSG